LTGQIYSDEILEGVLANCLQIMEIEVNEAVLIQDFDPKHSLWCKIS
jgi:hypothetical protein